MYSQNIHFYLCLRKTTIFIGACNYFLLHAQKQLFPLRMCKTTISICACAKHQLSTEHAQNNHFLLRMRRNNYFLCACARAHVHKTTSTRSYFLLHMSTQISFFCTRTYCISFSQSWAGDNSVATMWPCNQATKLFVIAILKYIYCGYPIETLRPNYFSIFFWTLTGPWGYIKLSRFRCREAKKLSPAQLCKKDI